MTWWQSCAQVQSDSSRRVARHQCFLKGHPRVKPCCLALLPGPAADTTLFVYGNVEVKNVVTAKFGPGIQFEVPTAPLNIIAS